MKRIFDKSDLHEFTGHFVAYDPGPSHVLANDKKPPVGEEGLSFGFIWGRGCDLSFCDIHKLIKSGSIHSSIGISNGRLSATRLSMRLATVDELIVIKDMLANQEAVLDYTNRDDGLCIVEDALANLLDEACTKELCLDEAKKNRQAARKEAEKVIKWIRETAPKIEFKNCKKEHAQMICPVDGEPLIERVVTRTCSVPSAESGHDIYLQCDELTPGKGCVGEKTKYVVRLKRAEPAEPLISPSTSAMLLTTALYSASFSALSEAVGDTLYLTGLCNKTNATRVKQASQLMMVYLSGSILSSAASLATTKVLEKTGCVSQQNAQRAGLAVAVGMNVGARLLTPTGLAVTAVSMASSRFGLWAEKQAVARLSQDTENSLRVIN